MKLYFESEQFLKSDGHKSGSLQSRIFNSKLKNSPKHVYALVYETLKYKPYIQQVIRKSKIKLGLKLKVSDELLLLLVHDLIFSKSGRIQSGKHPIKQEILGFKTRLHSELIKLKLKYNVKAINDLPIESDETPIRWFRINTIKIDQDDFFTKYTWINQLQKVSKIENIKPGTIYFDPYIPNLFGIHPQEKLTTTSSYKLGEVIIQDRASCFPAHILHEKSIHHQVIDATAAPGNKTTHAASYMDSKDVDSGVVYAFERDEKRVKILKLMCDKATGSKKDLIHVTHADFTSTKHQDFPNVTGLIVDPSCSGSGIFGRSIDNNQEQEVEEIDEDRLKKLANFQFTIVKHALKFPNANRVVYSTCSIHPHENERVVVDLLADKEIQNLGWKLDIRENVLNNWPRRGWKEEFTSICGNEIECEKLAGGCVRSIPKEDGGIGFFAACFVRNATDNKNQKEMEQNTDKPETINRHNSKVPENEEAKVDSDVEVDEDEWTGFD